MPFEQGCHVEFSAIYLVAKWVGAKEDNGLHSHHLVPFLGLPLAARTAFHRSSCLLSCPLPNHLLHQPSEWLS